MAVIIYPGSFNPIHYGHLSIVRRLCSEPGVDEIRMLVSPHNPLKDLRELAGTESRLAAAANAVAAAREKGFLPEFPPVRVSDFEKDLPEPRYTIRTLRRLQELEPDTRFILLIGGDNLQLLPRWYAWEELLLEFEIWVYPRTDPEADRRRCRELAAVPGRAGIRLLEDVPMLDISATSIRAGSAPQWKDIPFS